MSVSDPTGRQGQPSSSRNDEHPLAELSQRLSQARVSGDPAPEELERLVRMLAERDIEPGDRLAKALEGLARWSNSVKPQIRDVEPRDARVEAPAATPVSPGQAKPAGQATKPVASLRAALAEIAARQKALDDAEDAPALAAAPPPPAPAWTAPPKPVAQGPAAESVHETPPPAAAPPAYAPPPPVKPAVAPAPVIDPSAMRALREEIDRLGHCVEDLPTRSEIDALVREMSELGGRLTENRPARLDADSLNAIDALVGEVERMRGEAASPQTIDKMAGELRAISARLEEDGPNGKVATDQLMGRIEEMRAELAQFPRVDAVEGLAEEIRSVIARLDVSERAAVPMREAVAGLSGKVDSLHDEIVAIADETRNRGEDFGRINEAFLAELDTLPRVELVEGLGRQIEALTASVKARPAPQPAVAAMESLAGKVEAMDGKIDAFTAEARARGAETDRVVETVRAEIVGAAWPDAFDGLTRQIESLTLSLSARRAEVSPKQIDALGEKIDSLAAGLDTRSEEGAAEAFVEIVGRLESIDERVGDVAAATRARGASFERVEQAVASIAERLVELQPGGDYRAVETEVARAVEGLERNDGRIDDLHAAFAGLASRIESSCADLGAKASRAAMESARDAFAGIGGGDASAEISRTLGELRATASHSERRTAETLETVRETLERLTERLDADAARRPAQLAPEAPAIARAPVLQTPTASSADAAEGARAAARRAFVETFDDAARTSDATDDRRGAPRIESVSPFNPTGDLAPDHPLDPGSGRARIEPAETPSAASFIAAARRAQIQSGAEEPVGETPSRGAPGAAKAAGLVSSLKARKRPLVLGLAAALVVLAALYAASRLTDSPESKPAPSPLSERVEPDAPAPVAEARPATPAVEAAPAPEAETAPPPAAPPATEPAPRPRAEFAPPRAPAGDLTPMALAEAARPAEPPSARPAPPEPEATGSISRGSNELPDAIGGATLRLRAAQGDPSAQLEVADRLLNGRGVPADPAAAVRWLQKAAAQGLAPAQHRLGSLYEKGNGVARDFPTARRWYEQAAASGNVRAMHNLGVIHAEGGLGKPDLDAASVWFRMAAERGLVDSQYNLAVLAARGLGGKRNLADAYKWFALAAAQGDADAARKRDEVGRSLGGALKGARASVDAFQPRAVDPAANDVPEPAGGWDKLAAKGGGTSAPRR